MALFNSTRWLALVIALATLSSAALAQKEFELDPDGFKEVKAPDPATAEGQLWLIRKAIAEDRSAEAWNLADDWIESHPNHPMLVEAYLLRGDAKSARNHFYKALYDYEHVIRNYPGSAQFNKALQRELKIADAYANGLKRKLWGIRMVPAKGEAEEIFIRIQERAPGKIIAEKAGIKLGDHYFRESEMRMAVDAYDLFLKNYPKSQWREYAMKQRIIANLATFKGPRFDPTGLIEAQGRLQDYKDQFPAAAEQIGSDALLTRIDESLAERALNAARWYEKKKNTVSAKFMYKRLISDHPRTASAQVALGRLRELDPDLFTEISQDDENEKPAVEDKPALPVEPPVEPVANPDRPDQPVAPEPEK